MTNCRMLYGPAAVRTCLWRTIKRAGPLCREPLTETAGVEKAEKETAGMGELRTETAVMGDPKTETAEGNKILSAAVF